MADLALDIYAHAMPMPLLTWLADQNMADVAPGGGVVRLDPRVSGVGPGTDLPLAVSQYDPLVRLTEMDDLGISHHAVSMPPFLFCSTADDEDLVERVVRGGNDELATYAEGRASVSTCRAGPSATPVPRLRRSLGDLSGDATWVRQPWFTRHHASTVVRGRSSTSPLAGDAHDAG